MLLVFQASHASCEPCKLQAMQAVSHASCKPCKLRAMQAASHASCHEPCRWNTFIRQRICCRLKAIHSPYSFGPRSEFSLLAAKSAVFPSGGTVGNIPFWQHSRLDGAGLTDVQRPLHLTLKQDMTKCCGGSGYRITAFLDPTTRQLGCVRIST